MISFKKQFNHPVKKPRIFTQKTLKTAFYSTINNLNWTVWNSLLRSIYNLFFETEKKFYFYFLIFFWLLLLLSYRQTVRVFHVVPQALKYCITFGTELTSIRLFLAVMWKQEIGSIQFQLNQPFQSFPDFSKSSQIYLNFIKKGLHA